MNNIPLRAMLPAPRAPCSFAGKTVPALWLFELQIIYPQNSDQLVKLGTADKI